MTTSIDPELVHAGDTVTITTRTGDRATGPAGTAGGGRELTVTAFGVPIPFARRSLDRNTGRYRWRTIAGLAIVQHQQPLIPDGR